jgi:hypothetical protein
MDVQTETSGLPGVSAFLGLVTSQGPRQRAFLALFNARLGSSGQGFKITDPRVRQRRHDVAVDHEELLEDDLIEHPALSWGRAEIRRSRILEQLEGFVDDLTKFICCV